MKKIFSILTILCLTLSAWAATGLSYRMVVTAKSEVTVAASSTQSLSNYAAFIDGSAEIKNGQTSDAKVIQSGVIRLTAKEGYIHVTLNRALVAGDVIRYENGGKDSNNMYITSSCTRASGCNIFPATDYTVDSKLAGATELYFWYGSNNSATYMTQLTVTTSSPEVVYYDFEGETYTEEITTAMTLNNGMSVGNGGDKIVTTDKGGYTKAFSLIGKNENRALVFNVTDPCTIEVWAASASTTARNIFISEGKYTQTTGTGCADVFGEAVDNASIHYATYTYSGTDDNKTMYLSANGGVYIYAVRVIYNKVRPTADLALKINDTEVSEYTLTDGNTVTVMVASTSTVTPTRAKTAESADVVSISEAADKLSYTVRGHTDKKGDYTMIIRQAASADYRAAEKQIVFHVTNESAAAIHRYSGSISANSKIWTSTTGGITMADDKEAADENCIRLVANKQDLLLAKGHNYTISVPANQKIVSATIVGYSAVTEGTNAKIRVSGSTDSEDLPYDNAETPGQVVYNNINARTFTITPVHANVKIQVQLVLANYTTFPLTISNGYATFCAAEDVTIPEGVTAYVATGSTSTEILLEEIAGGKIKANTGVVLMSETDGEYTMTITKNAPAMTSSLVGTTARIANPGSVYCLNSSEGAFQQYTGAYIPANKAYFAAPAGAPARMALRIGHVATGLENNANANVEVRKYMENGQILIRRGEHIYNVQGQLVK